MRIALVSLALAGLARLASADVVPTSGDLIQIDDLTDTVTVAITNFATGNGGGTLSNISISGESATFTYTLPGGGVWAYSNHWVQLLESDATVSDIFQIVPHNG